MLDVLIFATGAAAAFAVTFAPLVFAFGSYTTPRSLVAPAPEPLPNPHSAVFAILDHVVLFATLGAPAALAVGLEVELFVISL